MKADTRTRILVSSLLLFNEKGEPNTTTNEIADSVDISPGNLYYHFHKKSDLVAALLAEFQADARRVLQPPESSQGSLDDFWVFLHQLLELTGAYRFLLRDMESLQVEYPRVGTALKHFARALIASFELNLHAMVDSGVMKIAGNDARLVSRNLAVIALFAERFDSLIESTASRDDAELRVARSVLNVLQPFVDEGAALQLAQLAAYYRQ